MAILDYGMWITEFLTSKCYFTEINMLRRERTTNPIYVHPDER